MGPLALAAIPAGIYAGAQIAGGAMSSSANAKEAARNRAFQKEMRATQWQTSVEDLRKAGLNPALAYSQGPAGNLAGSTMDVGQVGEGVRAAGDAVSKGMQVSSARLALQQQAADVERAQYEATIAGEGSKQARYKTLMDAYTIGAGPGNFHEIDPKSPFASQVEQYRLRAQQMGLSMRELEAMAKMWKDFGEGGKVMQFLLPFFTLLLRSRF